MHCSDELPGNLFEKEGKLLKGQIIVGETLNYLTNRLSDEQPSCRGNPKQLII